MPVNLKFTDPNSVSKIKGLVANFLCKRFIFQTKVAYFFTTAGDILRLQSVLKVKFGTTKHVSSREILWNKIIENIQMEANIYEFGVAYGYTTNYFLTRIKQNVKYQGFDLFTGLPTAWRNLARGTFSTDGNPPPIKDERLTWIIGDVTQTFTSEFELRAAKQNIFLFDFDLFEPTLHAYQVCKNQNLFCENSIVYFDEAFDPEELLIIQNYLFQDVELDLIGSTWGAVAFQVRKN